MSLLVIYRWQVTVAIALVVFVLSIQISSQKGESLVVVCTVCNHSVESQLILYLNHRNMLPLFFTWYQEFLIFFKARRFIWNVFNQPLIFLPLCVVFKVW